MERIKNVEELDLYKEYRHAYDKATELEFFDKQQEADYYYEYAQQLKKKIDNGETILYKVNFWERDNMEDDPKIDNRICLFYVADRLMEITEISDRRQMEKAIDEFKDECLRNLGVNALHDHNN